MTSKSHQKMNTRIMVIGLFFSGMFIVVGGKAAYLQVWQTSWLSERAANQYETLMKTPGKRGNILDSRLQPMAVSINGQSLAAYPSRIPDRMSAASALAPVLSSDPHAIAEKLNTRNPFVWLKRQATPKEARAVRQLDMAGIDFIPEYSRFYPNKVIAAQVLGFAGIDGQGLEGLEYLYNDLLKADGRTTTVLKDALGRGFESGTMGSSPPAGRNIVLTIDQTIQFIVEKSLKEAVSRYDAASAIAIVLRPETGAVLALAHAPTFNPNAFHRFDPNLWRNRAITDSFEPGSTMKIFTAAAALEHGGLSADTPFFCERGRYQLGRHTIHDTQKHDTLTIEEIVMVSSNIGAVKISQQLGPETMYLTLRRFGFGEKTAIDCPGEIDGSLSHYRRWTKMDQAAIAFGQGIAVTAIQLVTATAAIANGGRLMKPFVVQAVTDQNGRPLQRFEPTRIRQAISPATARALRRIMGTVVSKNGTGRYAALDGYTAGGKTGTAQKPDENGAYAKDRYMASFVGFAPADHPEVAVLVVFDEPKGSHYGGVVAAPVFKQIVEETLHHLNISPESDEKRLTASTTRGVAS